MPIVEMILFRAPYRCFKPMDTILFNPGVNLLVGPNGSGKSTVLSAICGHAKLDKAFWLKDEEAARSSLILMSKDGPQMRAFAHDYENDSPRTSPAVDIHGMLPGSSIVTHRRMSHGQSTIATIAMMENIKPDEPFIIILDEPDTGLAPAMVKRLARCFSKLEKQGCQILAAVHNPWLINEFPQVWDMEKMKFLSSLEYLDGQLFKS
jgi:ABC-type Mn2+/Zn2+ transport system ATPase subunit